MTRESALPVLCQPARPSDTPQALALAARIWEGDDYIPYVWDDWLADPHGVLAVAEWQGQVVGLGKLTRHSDQSWWLEGLRTHPDFAGQGVATRLMHYLLETWKRVGAGILRFATHSENTPIHRISQRLGYQKIGELIIHKAPALAPSPPADFSLPPALQPTAPAFQPVTLAEAPLALAALQAGPVLALNLGLLDYGRIWTAPSLETLQGTIKQGLAWWWHPSPLSQSPSLRDTSSLLLISLDDEVIDAPLPWVIQGLTCPLDQLTDMLVDIRRLAHLNLAPTVSWNINNCPELLDPVLIAGYQRAWDLSLYIFTLEM